MRKLLLLFILIFFVAETKAQELKRLTINNISDGEVSIYRNKIVWASHGNGYSDIFLAENDTITQLTYGTYNIWPDVDSKYIIWLRSNADHSFSLIYYDGFEERQLDNGSIFYPQTVGKYILWWKYINLTVENHSVQLIVFDGENTKVISESNKGKLIYGMQFTENEILYIENDTFTRAAQLISYKSEKRTVIDSIENGLFMAEGSYHGYNHKKVSKPFFLYYAYDRNTLSTKMKSYKNGKLTELPQYLIRDSNYTYNIVEMNEDFITILAQKKWLIPDSSVLKIWKDNELFTIAEYPFANVNYHPELNDITTFFSVRDSFGWSNLYLFKNNKITHLNPGKLYIGWQYFSVYGKSLVVSLSPDRFSNEKYEVYYYCGEDSCINAIPIKDFKAKIYYKTQAKKIAVEIETPQAERFNLEVYDLLGRKVAGTSFISLYGTFTFLFPTESLIQGMYIVKLQNPSRPEQQLTQKLFIPN